MKPKSGYVFKKLEGEPEERLEQFDIPPSVALPLGNARSLVSKGDRVSAGQVIARSDDTVSTPVVASIGGTVQRIAGISPEVENRAVFVESDGSENWQTIEGFREGSIEEKKKEEIEKLLYLGGVTVQKKCNIPTSFNSAAISPEKVQNIVIDMVEDRAYSPSVQIYFDDGVSPFIEGLKTLKKIMPAAEIHIALNNQRRELAEILASEAGECDYIHLSLLQPRYPQSREEMLTDTLLNKRTGEGPLSEEGILILDARGIMQVYEAVYRGRPAIDHIISLAGPGWKKNFYLHIREGTSLTRIVENYLDKEEQQRLIVNDVMTGATIVKNAVPITGKLDNIIALPERKTRELFAFLQPGSRSVSYTNSFLSALFPAEEKSSDTRVKGEQRPCIFCKYCQEVCPVDIIPHFLDKLLTATRTDHEELIQYGLMECIGCNLCSFVCPSKIPLAAHLNKGQELIQESESLTAAAN